MSLLEDIQTSLVHSDADVGSILLKLRLLAARLGSSELEEWVKRETEGYPNDVEIPDYRRLGVSIKATFAGGFGASISNAPIPRYLIKELAGDHWNEYELRQSAASIKELTMGNDESGVIHLDYSDLILVLRGQVYQGYQCTSVTGVISKASVGEILNTVKSRILDLTIGLEKVPGALEVGTKMAPKQDVSRSTTQVFHQTIYGNANNIANSGSIETISVSNVAGDIGSLVHELVQGGIPETDAKQLAEIAELETPSDGEVYGKSTGAWIKDNIGKAVDGTWKVGLDIASTLITKALARHYGLD